MKPDSIRRALRTLAQVGSVTALIALYNAFSSVPFTVEQAGAITTVGTLIVSFIQNGLEDAGAIPTLGKPDVSPHVGTTYAPGDPARSDLEV